MQKILFQNVQAFLIDSKVMKNILYNNKKTRLIRDVTKEKG